MTTETKTQTPGDGHPVDRHVGKRLKLRRTLVGITQGKLAEALGLTFQQVQKYERGANRVSASKLFQLAQVLDVPIQYFFDDMPDEVAASGSTTCLAVAEQNMPSGEVTLYRRQNLQMARHLGDIPDAALRKACVAFIGAVAESTSHEPSDIAAE